MTPVNNILDVMPVRSPEKKAPAGRQTDDFLAKLDRAARSVDSSRKDSSSAVAGRGNKQMQKAEARPVESEPVEEVVEAKSDEVEENVEALPDVFAAIPIFSAEELQSQQMPTDTVDAALMIEFVDTVATTPMDAMLPVDGAAPVDAAADLIATMDVAEQGILPEAELTLETAVLPEAADAEMTVEVPKASVKPIQNADEAKAEIAEPEADMEPEQQAKTTQPLQNGTEQTKPKTAETKTATVDSRAESFAKQAMQEVSEAIKKDGAADSQKSMMPQNASAEQEAMVSESLTAQEDSGGADVSTKQKETPAHIQQPMTATIAQDGKVDFKASMQELQPEQQFQLRQNVQTQIVDQVRSLVTKEKTEFYLQLKPEHLGGLSIMLAAGEKGLVAKLVTGSKDVHAMIQNDAAQIQESLRERGINVVQMEVVYDQMASATGKQDTNNGQGWESNGSGGSQGRLPEDAIEGTTMPYSGELSNYEVLAEQGGSVEFSA